MFKLTGDQYATFGDLVERSFVERLLSYLERNCPASALPGPHQARVDFAYERMQAARKAGLTWQSTIAEHARLSTLRIAGQRVVNPDRLTGGDARFADVTFTEALRRAAVLNRATGG
jgi:hypothetical protein